MTSRDEFQELSPKPVRSLLDASKHLNILILINRAHYAIQNSQLQLSQCLFNDAFRKAFTLKDFTVVMARRFFWHAVIADKTQQEEQAVRFLIRALPSIDHSREGDHLPPYLKKYGYDILDVLPIPNVGPHKLEERENWLRIVEEALRHENFLYTDAPMIFTASPTPYHVREDEDAMLYRLLGDDRNPNLHAIQHEVKPGLKTRPRTAPESTVPHFLPKHGLMKPLPMGDRKELALTLLDRSGTIKDERRSLPTSPENPTTDASQQTLITRPISVRRTSSARISKALRSHPNLRSLSKRLLGPIDTQKQKHNSEPETPSPLRKASLLGEDMTLKR